MSLANKEAVVVFQLADIDDVDILNIDLSGCGQPTPASINLNDEATCQDELKSLFLSIVDSMLQYDISIEFNEIEDYPREFIQEAIGSFVTDLANEVEAAKTSIAAEFK